MHHLYFRNTEDLLSNPSPSGSVWLVGESEAPEEWRREGALTLAGSEGERESVRALEGLLASY